MRDRPRLVVTAGSGSVVPYCLGARAMGAKLVFVETMARITNGSAAGRTLAPFASRVLVQWPELTAVYPGSRVCRPALLDGLPRPLHPRGGRGTFVAVGTHIDPFDRLLREVDEAVERGVLETPVIAQSGVSSYVPRTFRTVPWMTPREMADAIASTRHTITHAGCGLIARALAAHRRPMVLPRRAALGEHVDDHQLQITERLSAYQLVVSLEGRIERRHLVQADAQGTSMDDFGDLPFMEDALAEELDALVGSSALESVSTQSAARVGTG